MITEFGTATGAILDDFDSRDFQFEEIAGALPPFDWSVGFDIEKVLKGPLPMKDQGKSYSCGGQAFSTYGNAIEGITDGTVENHSAKFIYAQTHAPGGGSTGRDNANIVIKQGFAHENILPSMNNGFPPSEAFMTDASGINDTVRLDAAHDKALSYATAGVDIESIAQAIQLNNGVVLGIMGSNNGTWLSAYPNPPKNADATWLHWVYAGKAFMKNGVKYIGIFNSWGNVGEAGWQYLSEDYVNTFANGLKAVWTCWTLVFNPTKPNPSYQHNFMTDINYGDTGDEVKALQTALQINGQYSKGVPITGNYLDITQQAVLDFQERYVSPTSVWAQFVVWINGGNHVSRLTREKLNGIFAPIV